MKADLHIHSTASDGSMTPKEVVTTAHQLKLSTIALTDHDSIKGIKPARKTANELDITLLNGVELTVNFDNREIHLLAYAFDTENEMLSQCLLEHKKARIQRAEFIIKKLKKKGIELTIDEVKAEATSPNICRPHIASVLISKGYVATPKEAFFRYLSDEALGGIKNFYYPLPRAIAVIKKAGGISVLAHPGRLYNKKQLNKITSAGIDGLETVHPSHSYEIQQKLDQFAGKNNLLTTGGSDFHGRKKKYYKHFGTLGVNKSTIEKINRLAHYRQKNEQII